MEIDLFPIIFIAFFLQIPFTEADFPNKDVLEAAVCLRQFFSTPYFEKTLNTGSPNMMLLDGEYLGAFCRDFAYSGNMEERIKKAMKENNTDIKKCLENRNSEYVFGKYSTKLCPSESESLNIVPETLKTDDNEKQNYAEKLFYVQIEKFVSGVCQSNEVIEFNQLKDARKETDALICLARCADRFTKRMGFIFVSLKYEFENFFLKKITEIENAKLIESPKIRALVKKYKKNISNFKNTEYYKKNYNTSSFMRDEIANRKEELSIELFTRIEIYYLNMCSEYYVKSIDQLTPADIQSNDFFKNFDSNLFKTFSLHENCAKFDCGMGPDSIPVHDWVKNKTKDQKLESSTASKRISTLERDDKERRKFYNALLGIQNTTEISTDNQFSKYENE